MKDPEALDGIAIIGMAGRFPRSKDLPAYWRNLREGVEMITFFGDDGPAEAPARGPRLVRARGILDEIDQFDAAFFGYTPRIAEVMDPQHRLFLECAWQALEDAGYDSESYPGAIGVFAGAGRNSYFLSNLLTRPDILRELGPHQVATVSDGGFLSTRVSYKLNLRGPSLTVQTTCSTSLVAVHLASQSLLNGECDIALAGGTSVGVPQKAGHLYREGGIFSADGHCRAFDAQATGTVSGSGVGLVVLKRLADALADGDSIRAVIRGSAINNDGAQKIGYTAPSVEGQAAVIAEALNVAGIDPETVTYVEAHGTGTPLGDPIEIAALKQAYGARTDRLQFCAIGSAKTNMGHLDEAAGISGLIKTVLMLENREMPPSLHFEHPNPQIDFAHSPFFVNRELRPWGDNGAPRRAGVSSFGLGGTNAHLILEEAPAPVPSDPARPWQLLVLSARTESALGAATTSLASFLRRQDAPDLADVAFTLQVGRRPFDHRRYVVCRDVQNAADALEARNLVHAGATGSEQRFAAFLFPGQGAQAVGMGRALYESEETFRELVDRCAGLLHRELGLDLRRVLYPSPAEVEAATQALDQTRLAQPALFVMEYALASLWRTWGIEPRALLGHSVGEYVAACLAGVFSLEDALALVAARGRMMQDLPSGAMLAVPLPAARVRELLGANLSLAAVNAPERCVVSGPEAAVEALRERLSGEGVVAKRLRTSHAFHSALMDPILAPFAERVGRVALHPPSTPYVSNLTGTWIRSEEATDPGYWARHLRETVLFQAGLELLLAEPGSVLLEVGPGHTLTALVRRAGVPGADKRTVASLSSGPDDLASLLDSAGRLWTLGLRLDWAGFHGNAFRRHVPLPTYPFERKSYWIEARPAEPQETVEDTLPAAAPEALPPAPAAASRTTRKERILVRLSEILGRLFGLQPGDLDIHSSFLDMGADSLLLLQANDAIQKELEVKLSFFQLIDECPNLDTLAEHLDARLPADRLPPEEEKPAPAPVTAAPAAPAAAIPADADLRAVIAQQIELNNQVLRLLAGGGVGSFTPGVPVPAPAVADRTDTRAAAAFPFDPVKETGGMRLTPRQQKHLEDLIARYTARTRESKRRTELHRFHFADNRNSVGFRMAWKEMVYPILGERSRGSHLWDVDGNEYVDLAMGFGVNMLGHSPDFIREAVRDQLDKGMHVGPQSDIAGEVATLIHEITGMERVTFTNSGTEAVMTAMRLARAVTGRHKIAFFAGSYHGSSDGTLFGGTYGNGEQLRAVPRVPGVPPSMGADLLVLEYGTPQSLEIIAAHGQELAGVLVEPVQSRRPELQPREYLHELRRLTEKIGAALIFDETITGFRPHPRGAQGVFDLKADIVTYGKVVGGGMPIGIITGIPRFMDAIDGGAWRFGDASAPEAAKTFFAGTFCKHPLAMAAARASLRFMQEQGPGLQRRLNERAEGLIGELTRYFTAEEVGIRIAHFGSQLMFVFSDPRFVDLFFFHLVQEGVFVWEGRTCFLSIAHTDEDIQFIVQAVKKSVEEMRRGGFFPERRATEPEEAAPRYLPLTGAQQQLWVEAQIGAEASSAYNESLSLRLQGRFDLSAMQATVQEIVDRHEALRATFSPEGDRQRIARHVAAGLAVADFTVGEECDRDLLAWRRAQEREPFNLVEGPLFRMGVARLAEDDHLLVLTVHHLVVDAWSLGLLLKEVGALYAARHQGIRVELPAPGSFSDYAVRQPEERELEASRQFWLEQLGDGVPVLELPADFPRPALKTYNGARVAQATATGLLDAVKALGARQRCTPFVVLLTAFELLLHRLSGQADIVVGVPSAGQPRAGADGLVGYCINLLPVRSRIGDAPSVAELLLRTRSTFSHSYEHQDGLMASLPRDFSRSPLVTVTFNMDWPVSGKEASPPPVGDLRILPVESASHPAKFELMFDVVAAGGELQLACTYNTDLFRETTICRWMGCYQQVLSTLAADPVQRVVDVPVLPAGEREQILEEWGSASMELPVRRCLHELFERWCAEAPGAVALTFEGQTWSYGELNRQANRLAHRLILLGVGPDVPVAICLERSPEMMVAILGILKAGGAYVPLDPEHPRERLALLLEDSRAPLVLSQTRLNGSLPDGAARVVFLDQEEGSAVAETDANPLSRAQPENLAYIIYTSGSTGMPKGTLLSHANVVRLFTATEPWFRFGPADVWALFHSYAFDFSVWEMWGALLYGGRLVVVPFWVSRSPEELRGLLARERVTVLNQTPSAFRQLLAGDPGEEERRLRYVIFGGEALDVRTLAPWFDRHPEGEGPKLINMYGITETTVHVTYRPIQASDLGQPVSSAVGRQIPDLSLYLFDRAGQPVPIGVPGEIHVGGPGLARGYLHRPDLTAERFVPNPFARWRGERLYRSGDLARRLPDGDLEFLGRIDHQVKVRGFRIELGEIEAVLGSFPMVCEAVALMREDAPGERRLVAYVVPLPGEAPSQGELRWFLRERLPDYMVPAIFVLLESLPLTPNGKLDRRALPRPERIALPSAATLRTPAEEVVAGIWSEVLGSEVNEAESSFFDLGGDSLLATRVMLRIRKTFGVDVELRALFEGPTVRRLAAAVEDLQRAGLSASMPIQRSSHDTDRPLSFAQQRLWFIDRLEPGIPLYNIPAAVHIRGCLDGVALARAFREIVRRHEILRTGFEETGGRIVPRILQQACIDLPTVDLRGLPEMIRTTEVDRLTTAESLRAFDLSQPPLLRTTLLSLQPAEHVALITMHHIASDGWSMGIFIRECGVLYQAYAAGLPSPLPELVLQYADFARWQWQWMRGEVLAAEVAHWRSRLAGVPPVLELPTDHPRPAVRSYPGAARTRLLSMPAWSGLQILARRNAVSYFMLLEAAFEALLYRYTGQPDFCVGTPVAGRGHLEVEDLIGLFVNTLVLRSSLAGRENPFEDLLTRVRERVLEAHLHQALPFEKLVEVLEPERSLDHSPVFQVMLQLDRFTKGDLALEGLTLIPQSVEVRTAKFDLQFSAVEREEGLAYSFVYRTDLFETATIDRMLAHWENLALNLAADPRQPLEEAAILSAAEQAELLATAPVPETGRWQGRCLHEIFAEEAALRPESVALVYEGAPLTYSELDRRANRLAHRLRALGVGPDVLVGLCLERSSDLIVGIVGILKAGGAYVPLDPSYPRERLSFILEDAAVPVLVSHSATREAIPEAAFEIILLDDLGEEGDCAPPAESGVSSENAAYVIYTSGSTGRPKGVVVSHANVCRLFSATESWFDFSADDVWTLFHSYAFDFSVWEIWGALLYGGRIVIVPFLTSRSPEAFDELLRREGVTVLGQTPSAFRQLVSVDASARQEGDLRLRWVVFGGEALDPQMLEPWFSRHGEEYPLLVNMYGITETTVHVTFRPITRKDLALDGRSPIGVPIADLRLYLLDGCRQLVPAGIPGELYVGGAGLARGYLNRPDLTADRFAPDPFSDHPGGRLYRTGDLARRLPGGELEYLGRTDHQVKIRGFRIELGEIEAVLGSHPGVTAAVVSVYDEASGDRRLIAHVVLDPDLQMRPAELRTFLAERLPSYMLPSAIVPLPELPLTSNGKLDRGALSAIDRSAVGRDDGVCAPRTQVEAMLVEIWAGAFHLETVGVEDDFFDLGGHSLLAVQLVARIREIFGVDLPLRYFFETPKLADLGGRIEAAIQDRGETRRPPIVPVPRNREIPLSFGQQRLFVVDRLQRGAITYNLPHHLILSGPFVESALIRALDEIFQRHEVLRTSFQVSDGRPVQVIAPNIPVASPVIDLRDLPESRRRAEARRLARDHAQQPFDLSCGPLLASAVVRLEPLRHLLLLTMHHIVSDAHSMELLLAEMAELYKAFSAGEPSPLAALPVQYADFACWQRDWLRGAVLETQLAYWREQLLNAPPLLRLESDRPRPVVQTSSGAGLEVALPAGLVNPLRARCREEQVTLFMALFAAYAVVLHRHSGVEDIVVAVPISYRHLPEIGNLIGFFVNTLILRVDLSENPSFRTLLERVRKVVLDAFTHQDLPFEKIIEELQPVRDPSYSPLVQVAFSLLDQRGSTPPLAGGLQMQPLSEIEATAAQYEVSLTVAETDSELRSSWLYNRDLFSRRSVEQMAEDLQCVLELVAQDPGCDLVALHAALTQAGRRSAAAREEARKRDNLEKLARLSRRPVPGNPQQHQEGRDA